MKFEDLHERPGFLYVSHKTCFSVSPPNCVFFLLKKMMVNPKNRNLRIVQGENDFSGEAAVELQGLYRKTPSLTLMFELNHPPQAMGRPKKLAGALG